ncbi:MAG: hypothetical protein ABI681_11030 [Gemmatimonadales bacterium]
MKRAATIGSLAFLLTACTAKENAPAADSAAAPDSQAMNMGADPDRAAGGGALPAGYSARTDKADAKISDAKYLASGDQWEVTTGPAHILYSPSVMGNGNYTAAGTIEQLEAPAHPEAFGLFIGGRDLDAPAQTYTYFIVRGTGDVAIKVREGDKTRDVVKWTPSKDVPKADASGKATYALAAQVTGDAVKFSVNGKEVASVSKAGLPTDGIAGLRINHNLHVKASPVVVKTP